MMVQSSLLDQLNAESEADKAFKAFDAKNPKVYQMMVKMVRQLHDRGHKRIGIAMIYEVMRWRTMLETTDPEYKLNNNYKSRYARKLVAEYPEFDGMFAMRELKS